MSAREKSGVEHRSSMTGLQQWLADAAAFSSQMIVKLAICAVVYLVFRVANFADPPLAAAILTFLLLIWP